MSGTASASFPDIIPSVRPDVHYNSFDFIRANHGTSSHPLHPAGNLSFDPIKEDAGRAGWEFNKIESRLLDRIANDHALKEIAASGNQEVYERHLSQMTREAMKGTFLDPAQYRKFSENGDFGRNINRLTKIGEFDCEQISIVTGLLMQSADTRVVELGIRANPTQFYYMRGAVEVNHGGGVKTLGGHAFIASAATGNIIDATANPDIYKVTQITFQEMVAGLPTLTHDGKLYAASDDVIDTAIVGQRLQALKNHANPLPALEQLRSDLDSARALATASPAERAEVARRQQTLDTACQAPVTITTESGSALITSDAKAVETVAHTSDSACFNASIPILGTLRAESLAWLRDTPKLPVIDIPRAATPQAPPPINHQTIAVGNPSASWER
jgi:hypothetical protein